VKQFRNPKSLNIILATILLVAQLGLIIHEAEIEKHAFDSSCEYCIHYISVDKVSLSNTFALLPSDTSSANTLRLTRKYIPDINFHFNPRAPPLSFA